MKNRMLWPPCSVRVLASRLLPQSPLRAPGRAKSNRGHATGWPPSKSKARAETITGDAGRQDVRRGRRRAEKNIQRALAGARARLVVPTQIVREARLGISVNTSPPAKSTRVLKRMTATHEACSCLSNGAGLGDEDPAREENAADAPAKADESLRPPTGAPAPGVAAAERRVRVAKPKDSRAGLKTPCDAARRRSQMICRGRSRAPRSWMQTRRKTSSGSRSRGSREGP